MGYILILLLSLFVGSSALADPALELRRSRESMAADVEHQKNCEIMRERGTCRGMKLDFIRALSRDLDSCRLQYAANKCDEFIRANPKFYSQRNTCDSVEICRNQSEYALLQGCADFGIEVGRDLLSSVKSLADGCSPGFWKGLCVSKNVLKSTGSTLWYYMWNDIELSEIPKLPAAARAAYQTYKKKSACLNPRAQQKLACYVAVTAGTMVVGTGAAAVRYQGLLAEMRAMGVADAVHGAKVRPPTPTKLLKLDPDEILQARVSSRLGFETHVSESGHALSDGAFRGSAKLTKANSGQQVGFVIWKRDRTGTVLEIEGLDANIPGKGVGTELFDYALAANPKVARIKSTLIEDNYDAFMDARKAGKDCFGALRATPAYKIRAKAGFTRILGSSCSEKHGELDFIVGK